MKVKIIFNNWKFNKTIIKKNKMNFKMKFVSYKKK